MNIEAEDTACVLLKFKSGAFGIIEATTATRPNDLEGVNINSRRERFCSN